MQVNHFSAPNGDIYATVSGPDSEGPKPSPAASQDAEGVYARLHQRRDVQENVYGMRSCEPLGPDNSAMKPTRNFGGLPPASGVTRNLRPPPTPPKPSTASTGDYEQVDLPPRPPKNHPLPARPPTPQAIYSEPMPGRPLMGSDSVYHELEERPPMPTRPPPRRIPVDGAVQPTSPRHSRPHSTSPLAIGAGQQLPASMAQEAAAIAQRRRLAE